MNTKKSSKNLYIYLILVTVMAILFLIDDPLSKAILIKTPILALGRHLRIGICNICLVLIAFNYKHYYAYIAAVVKSVLGALFYLSPLYLLFSLAANLVCVSVMLLLKKRYNNPYFLPLISGLSAITHMLIQFILVFLVYYIANFKELLSYAFVLFLYSLISGLIVGGICILVQKFYLNKQLEFENIKTKKNKKKK